MKAILHHRYGSPDVLELHELELPVVGDHEVLVHVHASSVNPMDWHAMTGVPYLVRLQAGLRRPRQPRLGTDFAGIVEAVGTGVERFRPGDHVFGGRNGAFGEYVCVPDDKAIVAMPDGVTFEQAAAVPVAALTALQGLRDKGGLRPGQRVLVNGASGGVGTFAVQIAKAVGAEVTGVCSTRNVELVQSLGADEVVDYTAEDFTRSGRQFDLIVDIAGSRSWSECKRVLAPGAKLVVVGGPKTNRWIGSLAHLGGLRAASIGGNRKAVPFLAKLTREDLTVMAELVESGKVTPAIDKVYELSEAAEAMRYVGEGHARAKVVVVVPGGHLE
jgi:NADPH:quinone reductase-like Zn-dependent oxidoreductase